MLIVVLSIDCGRADHFDGSLGLTPHLEALRPEGTTFTQAISQSQNTLSSHVSLLSSNYLFQHGIYSNFERCELPPHVLPHRLAERGFACRAFTGVQFLASSLGDQLGPRDERYPASVSGVLARLKRRFRGGHPRRPLEDSLARALQWLDGDPAEHQFLLLHAYDTHMLYEAPKALLREHAPRTRAARRCEEELEQRGWFTMFHPEYRRRVPVEHFPARYRAAVRHVDACLGRLVAGLRERGLWDETLLVVTADHGESLLGDHGLYCVHKKLFDTTVHVPLWIRFPGGEHAGKTVDALVELTDVAPTVARAVGFAEPLYMGHDLGAVAAGEAPGRELAFSEHVDDLLRAVRNREHVWVERVPDRENRSGFPMDEGTFFRRDGSSAAPGAEACVPELEAAARELMASRPEVAAAWGRSEAVDDHIAEQLRQLGYL